LCFSESRFDDSEQASGFLSGFRHALWSPLSTSKAGGVLKCPPRFTKSPPFASYCGLMTASLPQLWLCAGKFSLISFFSFASGLHVFPPPTRSRPFSSMSYAGSRFIGGFGTASLSLSGPRNATPLQFPSSPKKIVGTSSPPLPAVLWGCLVSTPDTFLVK